MQDNDFELEQKFQEVDPRERRLAELQGEVRVVNLLDLSKYPPLYQNEVARSAELSAKKLEGLEMKVKVGNPEKMDFDFGSVVYDTWNEGDERNGVGKGSNLFGISLQASKDEELNYINRARVVLGLSQRKNVPVECREFVLTQIESLTRSLERTVAWCKNTVRLVGEIEDGRHYLSHGVSNINAEAVMASGFLCSRQAQINRFGKAVITTSNPEGFTIIEYADGRVEKFDPIRRQFMPVEKGQDPWTEIRLIRERGEVLFDQDRLYGNIGLIYFVFPAGELLEDNPQHVFNDGIHLFRPDYSQDNKKGYEVNLVDKRHLLVARKRDETYVRSLIDKAGWIKDKERYWAESVVLTDTIDLAPGVGGNKGLLDLEEQLYEEAARLVAGKEYRLAGKQVGLSGARLTPGQISAGTYERKDVALFRFM